LQRHSGGAAPGVGMVPHLSIP